MSEKEIKELKRASKQVLGVKNEANQIWKKISKRLGFQCMTAQPTPNKGERFFTAIPLENEQDN